MDVYCKRHLPNTLVDTLFLKGHVSGLEASLIPCASSTAKSNECFDILIHQCKVTKMHLSGKNPKVQSVGRHWNRNHHIKLPSLDTTGVYFFASLKNTLYNGMALSDVLVPSVLNSSWMRGFAKFYKTSLLCLYQSAYICIYSSFTSINCTCTYGGK